MPCNTPRTRLVVASYDPLELPKEGVPFRLFDRWFTAISLLDTEGVIFLEEVKAPQTVFILSQSTWSCAFKTLKAAMEMANKVACHSILWQTHNSLYAHLEGEGETYLIKEYPVND